MGIKFFIALLPYERNGRVIFFTSQKPETFPEQIWKNSEGFWSENYH